MAGWGDDFSEGAKGRKGDKVRGRLGDRATWGQGDKKAPGNAEPQLGMGARKKINQ